ncbi:helix-turn-helix domain-containing protein [Escherichia coli]|nr:helix-turn-helix domain-containing protein [Escherichia coli]
MKNVNQHNQIPCEEKPNNCCFELANYNENTAFYNNNKEANYIIFCKKGSMQLFSSLFPVKILHENELLFLPRMIDCHGETQQETQLIIHSFNNTVCRPELCILNYLYSHKKRQPQTAEYHCILSAQQVIITFMESVCLYLADNTGDLLLWHLKHKELIRLLSRYYEVEELQSFFHPMTDEDVPFKSLVLSHYMKAHDTQELADLCGYGVVTFRRVFKDEFGIAVYQWLIKKRSEHILYRLSLPYIPFHDIMEEFNFTSPQQFYRFCKTNLGDSPTNLRKKHQSS